jgi:hypothetical protein
MSEMTSAVEEEKLEQEKREQVKVAAAETETTTILEQVNSTMITDKVTTNNKATVTPTNNESETSGKMSQQWHSFISNNYLQPFHFQNLSIIIGCQ